jgi:small subunit ribosomal protein S20
VVIWTILPLSCKIIVCISYVIIGGRTLANIKSAIKRNKQNEKRSISNRIYRGRARTFLAKANTAVAEGEKTAAESAVMIAISALDKAAQKGVIHKNNAARRKSRLMKRMAALAK